MVCYHYVSAFGAIHCPKPHVGLQRSGGGGGGRGEGVESKGDGVGKGRGGVEARRLWGEYRRAVLGTSESVGINRQLTYVRPSLPVEHRPSTTPRHRTLFWAALAIPDQLVTCCFSSTSVSCLQLLRDRLVGLVVKASTSRAEGPGFESRWRRRDFFGVESYQ